MCLEDHSEKGYARTPMSQLAFPELSESLCPPLPRAAPAAAAAAAGPRPVFSDLRAVMVTLTGFCVFLNVYATQTLLPLFSKLFGASKFHVSLTVSATTIGIALAAPLVGLLAERVGRRQTMAGSVALLTLPILLAATAPGLDSLIAWRFVQGLVMPGIIAVTMAYVSEEFAGGGAAAVMSAYVAGNVLGGVTGRFLSGVVADHVGWRAAFVALGTLNAIGAVLVWRYLPHSRQPHSAKTFRAGAADMLAHLRNPIMLATFAVGMAALFALVATFTYITFYLAAPPFGLGSAALGCLFLVYFVGVAVTPLAGRWIDRLGHRTSLAASALASAAGVAMTLAHALPLVIAGLAICSTAIFVCQASAASYLGHIAGRAKASAAGLYTTFYYAGGTLGAAAPALAWTVGGWPACVALIVLTLIAAAVTALLFWRPTTDRRPRSSSPTAGELALAAEA
jgi:predicted MFS family arabinose efflux permease